MAFALRIPEMAQRDRFMRRAVQQSHVFAVTSEDGFARLPSSAGSGRELTLLWSSRTEAERWAPLIAAGATVEGVSLEALLGEVLPVLAKSGWRVGPDWNAQAIEPEVEPADLADRMRLELLDKFAQDVRAAGSLWVLEDAQGPALFVSITRPELLFMPCWSQRAHAEARLSGAWSHMRPLEVSLDSFVGLTLPWLALRGWLVGPEHWAGPGAPEVAPADLKARLVTRPVAA